MGAPSLKKEGTPNLNSSLPTFFTAEKRLGGIEEEGGKEGEPSE